MILNREQQIELLREIIYAMSGRRVSYEYAVWLIYNV